MSIRKHSFNQGQTLIETIVAIFVLTTGLASGLALAIFVFGSSSDVSEQVIATSLAREGVEAVRRMRDSNWLQGTLSSCDDLGTGQACYSNWLTSPFDITGAVGAGKEYRLHIRDSVAGPRYTLLAGGPTATYRLYQRSTGLIHHNPTGTPLNFFRKINIIYLETTGDYSATSPKVLVRSVVWWHGRNCPELTYYDVDTGVQTDCRAISEEILTNWKNY